MTDTPRDIMSEAIEVLQTSKTHDSDNWLIPADDEGMTDHCKWIADAAIKALEDAGYAIVPVEPTFDMMTDGVVAFSGKEEDGDKVVEMYKAMIKAAQEGE